MSPLVAIFLVVLVDVCAFTLVIPLLPIYAEHLAATPFQATLLVSTFAFFQLISGPLLGRLSDRVGRKPVLVASQIGTLIGLLILAKAHTLWIVFLARALDGATAGNLSLAQAYIADHTKPQDRAKSFAKIYIAFGIGFFVGPLTTGFLAGYGLAVPIYAASALSLLSIIASIVLLPAPTHKAPIQHGAAAPKKKGGVFDLGGYFELFRRPVLGGIFLELLLFSFCFANFTSGVALFDERRFVWRGHPFGAREIAFHLAFIGLLGIILQAGFTGRLVKKFGEPKLVVAGFISLALGYTGFALAHSIGFVATMTVLTVFGHGILRPALSALATQNAGKEEQGVVLGMAQSLTSVAQIAAPPICGFLISHGYLAAWSYVAALVAVVAIAIGRFGSARHVARPAPVGQKTTTLRMPAVAAGFHYIDQPIVAGPPRPVGARTNTLKMRPVAPTFVMSDDEIEGALSDLKEEAPPPPVPAYEPMLEYDEEEDDRTAIMDTFPVHRE